MEFENWITQLSDKLPNYNVRVFLLLSFTFLIIIFTLSVFFSKKVFQSNFINTLKTYSNLILACISITVGTLIYFFYSKYLFQFFDNNLLYIISPFVYLFIFSISKYIITIFKKEKIQNTISIVGLVIISTLFSLLLLISLLSVPHISLKSNSNTKILENSEQITLNFSSPQKASDIVITVSPEITFDISYDYFLGLKGLINSITITPTESFLPNQKVVVYTTGIQRIFPWGIKHENSQEFFTPREPEIEEVVLGADIQNVNITQPILIELDSNDSKSIEWKAIFNPDVEYKITRNYDNKLVIQPLKLKQGTDYELEIIKSVVKYNPKTLEKISTQSEESVSKISFKTTPPPGVLSYNRSSQIISNSEPLTIDFGIPLKEDSLIGKTSISPLIGGTTTLSSDKKQLIFSPNSPFLKNTEYVFTILSGIENVLGGYTENDIAISFKTPGYVGLSYSSPRNGSSGVSNTTSSISLTFNQPINHTSVQERFSIYPNISGSFSWSGDTLTYRFSSSLAYATKYTVTISGGVIATYGINSTSNISTSFTTKPETVLLNVPLYSQSESFTCNLAATRMVLAYKGISTTESSIRNSIGIGQDPDSNWVDKYGVHWGPISSYISSRGINNALKRGWNLTSALQEVKNGHPILIYVYNGSSTPMGPMDLAGGYIGYKGMHSAVIIGYIGSPESPTTVIVNDPWRGKRYLSQSSFRYLWYYSGYLNNTGIIIY